MAMVPVATQLSGVDLVKRISEGGVPKDAPQRSGYPLPHDLAEELRAMVARGATVFEGPAIMVKMPYPEPTSAPPGDALAEGALGSAKNIDQQAQLVAATQNKMLAEQLLKASPTLRAITAAATADEQERAGVDLRPSRVIEIMRLEGENASLRAALADLRAEYAALFALHIKQPTPIADVVPEFPVRALTHQRQVVGLLTERPA